MTAWTNASDFFISVGATYVRGSEIESVTKKSTGGVTVTLKSGQRHDGNESVADFMKRFKEANSAW